MTPELFFDLQLNNGSKKSMDVHGNGEEKSLWVSDDQWYFRNCFADGSAAWWGDFPFSVSWDK